MGNTKEKEGSIIFAVFGVIWIAIAGFTIPHVYGPILVPDEFGYWAHAAGYAGYDWHAVTSNFSWYSFGYGLLIYPFFLLIHNPVWLYRTMVGINFLLVWTASVLLYRVLSDIFPQTERKRIALISGVSMLYVAYITYAQMTLCEIVLVFLYVLLAYEMNRWCRKQSIGNSLLVLCIAGYMYAVHMRTVGILLATAVCMLLFLFFSKPDKRKAAVIGIVLVVLCCIFIGVAAVKSEWITQSHSEVYQELAKTNSYAGQIGKLRYLVTWSGIYHFFASLAGKVFYMGCSTFGIYFWGIAYLIRQLIRIIQKIQKKEETDDRDKILIWLLLSHLGSLAIAVVAGTSAGGRLDSVLYGRYFENSVPVILALGIYDVLSATNCLRRVKVYIGVQSLLFLILFFVVQDGDYTALNAHSITGIIYAVLGADRYDNYILLYAYLGGVAGNMLILLLCRIFAGEKKSYAVCTAVCILQLALAFFSTGYMALAYSDTKKEDSRMLMEAAELLEEKEGIFLMDKTEFRVCFAQYMLREPLQIMTSKEYMENSGETAIQKNSFIVVVRYSDMEATLKEQYTEMLQSPSYSVFFNLEQ